MNVAFCMDCMEGMKQYPDKYFDLAVVDPPYGDALANESGGGGTDLEAGSTSTRRLRFHGGGKNQKDPWNKYLRPLAQQQSQEREREREKEAVARTGGTWAEKYGKKS